MKMLLATIFLAKHNYSINRMEWASCFSKKAKGVKSTVDVRAVGGAGHELPYFVHDIKER